MTTPDQKPTLEYATPRPRQRRLLSVGLVLTSIGLSPGCIVLIVSSPALGFALVLAICIMMIAALILTMYGL